MNCRSWQDTTVRAEWQVNVHLAVASQKMQAFMGILAGTLPISASSCQE
jgi:hypothetical protein